MAEFSNKRVHFAENNEAGPSKRFVAPEDHSGENSEMDQETAKTLFENGAFLKMDLFERGRSLLTYTV